MKNLHPTSELTSTAESPHWISSAASIIRSLALFIRKVAATLNALNLFPVRDNDTGTNFTVTLTGVATDIAQLPPTTPPKELIRAITRSFLYHSRGNSGTILAAAIGGMADCLEDAAELTPQLLATALSNAYTKARSAISEPQDEGTMLAVIRDTATAARQAVSDGATTAQELVPPILTAAIDASNRSTDIMRQLSHDPKAGQDAGAYALRLIFQEIARHILDKIDDIAIDLPEDTAPEDTPALQEPFPENEDWQPGTPLYCTELILRFTSEHPLDPASGKQILGDYGNSIVFIVHQDTGKAHVHTDHPWDVCKRLTQHCDIVHTEFTNMRIQTEARSAIKPDQPSTDLSERKSFGIVAVGSGQTLRDLYLLAGIDQVVDGGQTNNPSTGEIYEAIRRVHAHKVIVLPGNKNIVLSAQSACTMAQTDGITAVTIPTKDIPQTFEAIISLPADPDASDFDTLCRTLTQAAAAVRSASITVAAKDYNNGQILALEGQFISLIHDKVALAYDDITTSAAETIRKLIAPNACTISLYAGADLTISEEALRTAIAKVTPVDVKFTVTKQPVYLLEISVDIAPE